MKNTGEEMKPNIHDFLTGKPILLEAGFKQKLSAWLESEIFDSSEKLDMFGTATPENKEVITEAHTRLATFQLLLERIKSGKFD